MKLYRRRHSLLSLDIQPNTIRLLQLKKLKKGFLLERATSFATPPDIFTEGKISRWEMLSTFLTDIVTAFHLRGLRVAVSLPINQVRLQKLALPAEPKVNLRKEIFNHIENDLPGMKEQLCMDFYIIEQTSSQIELIYVVTKQDYLQQLIQCIESCDLKIQIVDVDIFCMKRVLDFFITLQKDELHACIYIVENTLHLFVHTLKEIVSHVHWEMQNRADMASLIKNHLQVNQFDQRINQLIICASKQHCKLLMPAFAPSLRVKTLYDLPSSSIKTSYLLDQPFQEHIAEYLLAFGSALQVENL